MCFGGVDFRPYYVRVDVRSGYLENPSSRMMNGLFSCGNFRYCNMRGDDQDPLIPATFHTKTHIATNTPPALFVPLIIPCGNSLWRGHTDATETMPLVVTTKHDWFIVLCLYSAGQFKNDSTTDE